MQRLQQLVGRYPAALGGVFLCLGITAADRLNPLDPRWSYAALISILVISLPAMRWSHKRGFALVVGALFLFLGVHLGTRELERGGDFHPDNEAHIVHATVGKILARGTDFRILLLESGINQSQRTALPGSGRLFLRQNDIGLSAGDRIAFKSRLRKPLNRGNPGEFDWELDCRNNGIYWLTSARGKDAILVVSRGSVFSAVGMVFRVRESMADFLERYSVRFLSGPSESDVRGVLKAIIIGDLGELSPELNRSWAASGLAHMLSASGVHVGIVALLAVAAARLFTVAFPVILLWLPLRKVSALFSIPAMAAYCLLVGARVPAVRSTIMGLVVAVAVLLDRRWHSLNSLAVAGVLILLIYPLSLFTPSFQLSFAAVAGILVAVAPLMDRVYGRQGGALTDFGTSGIEDDTRWRKRLRRVRPLTAVALTSLCATAAVAPLLLQTFHSFPVYTIPANLVSDLLLTFALWLGLIAASVGMVFPEPASWILAPAAYLVLAITKVSDFFAGLPGAVIRTSHMGVPEFCLVSALACLALWNLRKADSRSLGAAAAALLLMLSIPFLGSWLRAHQERLQVVFLNVGKGDAALVTAGHSRGILIDGGMAGEFFDAGRSIVAPFLDRQGMRGLDSVILSHSQMDHMGGLKAVVEAHPPQRFRWNPVEPIPSNVRSILTLAASRGTRIETADRNREPVRFGRASITFLNPPTSRIGPLSHREVNNSSVVCRIDYGDVSFLFCGDIEQDAETELQASGMPLRASVLKVAHHGGRTASSNAFLEAVRPRVAIVSGEWEGRRGLPASEALDRLKQVGADVYITGRDGAVIVTTDGKSLDVKTGHGAKAPLEADTSHQD